MCVYVQSKRRDKINAWICAPAIDSVSVFFFLTAIFRPFQFYFSDGLFQSGNFSLPFSDFIFRVPFSEYVLFGPTPIRTISGVLELISRFEFEFCRPGNFFSERFEFLVCSKFNHTHHVAVHVPVLWPVCTHTIPIQCCRVRDDS